jgi:hypothetical protein
LKHKHETASNWDLNSSLSSAETISKNKQQKRSLFQDRLMIITRIQEAIGTWTTAVVRHLLRFWVDAHF